MKTLLTHTTERLSWARPLLRQTGRSAVADEVSRFLNAVTYAILAALGLYLDFTNLFLFLLRFSGNRRE